MATHPGGASPAHGPAAPLAAPCAAAAVRALAASTLAAAAAARASRRGPEAAALVSFSKSLESIAHSLLSGQAERGPGVSARLDAIAPFLEAQQHAADAGLPARQGRLLAAPGLALRRNAACHDFECGLDVMALNDACLRRRQRGGRARRKRAAAASGCSASSSSAPSLACESATRLVTAIVPVTAAPPGADAAAGVLSAALPSAPCADAAPCAAAAAPRPPEPTLQHCLAFDQVATTVADLLEFPACAALVASAVAQSWASSLLGLPVNVAIAAS